MVLAAPPWNVLVFPADNPAAFEIHRSLCDAKEVILHAGVHIEDSRAAFYFSRLHHLPGLADPSALKALQDLLEQRHLHAVFATDKVTALWLAQHRASLKTTVLTPSYWDCQRCFADMKDAVTPAEGTTYAVDCFSQANGQLLYAEARTLAAPFHSIPLPEAVQEAKTTMQKFNLSGAWSFHLYIGRDGAISVVDVIPFITEGMAIHRASGPNFALLSLYSAAGCELEIDKFETFASMAYIAESRFLHDLPIEAAYVDFDGSLLLRDQVSTKLVALIYQFHNRKIPVTLLTRHPGDLLATLKKYRLDTLFDKVIHVTDFAMLKADYIREKNAILIDDSFRERHETYKRLGIPCFDPSSALCLLDYRDHGP